MKKLCYTLFISFVVFTNGLSAQCITKLDFRSWHAMGNPDAYWLIESDSVLRENGDAHPPTFFVTDMNLINVQISGIMRIEPSFDDDFIGFVFGYQKPSSGSHENDYEFILFDWKGAEGEHFGYHAYEGFHLTDVDKFMPPNEQWRYFWGHTDEEGFDILKRDIGENKGWEFNKDYHFKLTYTSTRIIISINGKEIFDVSGCFKAGGFGFYAFSQQNLLFKNFDYRLDVDFKTEGQPRCPGETIDFIAIDEDCSYIPPNIVSWEWDFGDGNGSNLIQPSHAYEEAGTYELSLIVKDNNNCLDTSIRDITIFPYPEISLFEDTAVHYGDSLIIDAGNPGAEYIWSNGGFNQTVEINNITAPFPLDLSVNYEGCISTHHIYVDLIPPPTAKLFMPSAFTPNGDGINDIFLPSTRNIDSFELTIFDRWGKRLFESDHPERGWDGQKNGIDCPVGTYVYTLTYSGMGDEIEVFSETLSGTVTLLR